MKRIVIIGASVAGHSTATNLRQSDPDCSITLVTEEPFVFYDRRRLPDFLRGAVKREEIFLSSEDFYSQNHIDFLKEKKVVSLNPKKMTVSFKEKEVLGFDFLVIASGRRILLPDIPGAKKQGVVTLQALKDFQDLSARAFVDTVCVTGVDEASAAISSAIAERYKVEVVNGEPTEIIGEGEVQAVKLNTGKTIGVSMVIFTGGFKSNIDFLKDTPVNLAQDFIMVDEFLRTNIENIFACGAVCGRLNWDDAVRDSTIIADNITQKLKEQSCQPMS